MKLSFKYILFRITLLFWFLSGWTISSMSQDPGRRLRQNPPVVTEEAPIKRQPLISDTTRNQIDTTSTQSDTTSMPIQKGEVETTIKYSASDSIFTSLDGQIVKIYGNAKIIYGQIELDAEAITIDYKKHTLHAVGRTDSTGKRIGYPVFKDGDDLYETREITYNFETGQARISEVVTTEGDGFLHGETVFKNDKDELFSINNTYTTCNLENPHFRIRSTKTKAIPDDKIVSGPFNLEINGVPTPLGFAFGMFPSPRKSASGIIMPSYGEEKRRGFALENGGYFFDISEFIKLKLTGSIYSKGGWGTTANTTYSKRYKYNGNFTFQVTKNNSSDKIEEPNISTDYRVSWSHTPQTKGTGRFSASVNAATSSFTKNNNLGVNYNPESTVLSTNSRKLNSSITYTKSFKGTPFTMGMSARHNQDIQTGVVDLQLPEFYATMRNVYPFGNVRKKNSTKWLTSLNLRYNVNSTNKISNNLGRITQDAVKDSIAPFSMENMSLFMKNAKNGVKHA
ncbi:MAG: putative LPS assembly protein LptD, partial [Cyclobacteriaceae bacterium]|nr:putative LPS assembly protein LptD [Cyclobacteriaceae bacterium]